MESEQEDDLKLPPIIESVDETIKGFLLEPENLPCFDWVRSQVFFDRDINLYSLMNVVDSPPTTTLAASRDIDTGEITTWVEVPTDESQKHGDMSMARPLLPPHLATRGSSKSIPFLPAGFEQEIAQDIVTGDVDALTDSILGSCSGVDMLSLPEFDFAKDYIMPLDEKTDIKLEDDKCNNSDDIKIDLESILKADEDIHLKDLWTDDEPLEQKRAPPKKTQSKLESNEDDITFENSLIQPTYELPVLKITSVVKKTAEWAEEIDVSMPVTDFEKRVPNMAYTYPFELDTFQKQAIIKLEEGNHVFVAAHTSAGKTVVAEYAIALSQNHCTRTIYTSPIKALSNQKYNDFKKTFKDVGLMTGDLQINPTAACLVMTTEILRSMLYNGSDVTRDLEFVIFDEVHYINNAERGHVWEEVLILLPAHVGIVLLSATVPNTLQFADWVGWTKKRKVYVVYTLRRPVPLCHYLYTGSGGKSKNERFLILDKDGNFLLRNYNEAIAAKEARENKFKKSFGPKGGNKNLTVKQEQTMWVALLDHLKADDKLPVVSFTLSRARCDQNAEALMSLDLTTAKEKSHIHYFFQKCIQKLKEPDRTLPQILRLQRVLANGIGVHHSGILPFLKEIVEMLFATGYIKMLFATETFAMGVNMPARTVIFDGIQKFDGIEQRYLMPAEYIQMAGRAGRRGLDSTGTVIILCKKGVPDLVSLKNMIMGTPQKLSSQFRLTYAMILSLFRVAQVSVEGMMQRSFGEFHQQLQTDKYRKELELAEKEVAEKCSAPLAPHLASLALFYDVAAAYIEELSMIMPILLEQPKVGKELVEGRVLAVTVGPYMNQLAVYLNKKGPRLTPYKVLLLETSRPHRDMPNVRFEVDENWYRMLSLSSANDKFGTEEMTSEHTVLCIAPLNILMVTKHLLKVNAEHIVNDWEKRQMPRFKGAAVGSSCAQAVQELSTLSHAVYSGATEIEEISLTKSLSVKTGEILHALDRVADLKQKLEVHRKNTNIANFKSEFSIVYERKQTERKRDKLRRLLSYENMALYPDYLRRVEVLRTLRYIDEHLRVAMKGKVACEMGTNELIITELIFRNILTDLDPAEIAAVLSCLVFQAKTQVAHELTARLEAATQAMKDVDDDLTAIESRFLVGQFEGEAERLNFGLVKVVYEWAQEKPFAQIMELTDVQEGVIVRCIQQLHEVLTDVRDAAKIIGDPILYSKMQEASAAIKRDIVFAASLYTTDKDDS